MPDELTLDRFDRRFVGRSAAVLLRVDPAHVKRCRDAIQWRTHPAWSQFVFAVSERRQRRLKAVA
jgi:hypothetical protein